MSRYIDVDKYRKDLLSAYDEVSMEFEVLDRQPLVQVISLDKVKQAIEEIEQYLLEEECNGNHEKGIMFALEILEKNIGESKGEDAPDTNVGSKKQAEPCGDAVSRKDLERLKRWRFSYDTNTTIPKSDLFVRLTDIRALPNCGAKRGDK